MLTSYVGALYVPVNALTGAQSYIKKWTEQTFHAVPSERYPDPVNDGPSGLRAISHENYYADKLDIYNNRRGHRVEKEMAGVWDAATLRFVRTPGEPGPVGGVVYEKGNANPLYRVPSLHCPLRLASAPYVYEGVVFVVVMPSVTREVAYTPHDIAHWYTIFVHMFTDITSSDSMAGIRGRVAWVNSDEVSGYLRWSLVDRTVRIYTHPLHGADSEEKLA